MNFANPVFPHPTLDPFFSWIRPGTGFGNRFLFKSPHDASLTLTPRLRPTLWTNSLSLSLSACLYDYYDSVNRNQKTEIILLWINRNALSDSNPIQDHPAGSLLQGLHEGITGQDVCNGSRCVKGAVNAHHAPRWSGATTVRAAAW